MMNTPRFFLVVLALVLAVALFVPAPVRSQSVQVGLQDFGLVAPGIGWVLLDNVLYMTADDGESWRDITPGAGIAALSFVDETTARAILLTQASSTRATLTLATTDDPSLGWQTRSLSLFANSDVRAQVDSVSLFFVDSQTGWLLTRQASSANFSIGTLFVTHNGGATWQMLDAPAFGELFFESSEVGWIIGGLDGAQAFITLDGGATWQETDPPQLALPDLAFATDVIWRGEAGWARTYETFCAPVEDKRAADCGALTYLWSFRNDEWQPLALPGYPDGILLYQSDEVSALSNVVLGLGQGFDKCEAAPLNQMQTWWDSSPYMATNLYIGGSARACANTLLSASYLRQLSAQGWKFIPTWVGPQAACTSYRSRMSWDPATAYQQGRNEASAALAVAKNLGLTYADGSGTVIYYDLEAYTNDTACRTAAKWFMAGWVERMHEADSVAGVYGSPCTSYLSDFQTISNVPDAIWAAQWLLPAQYRTNVSVFGLACGLSDSMWANNQRLRQYSGDHNETWGGVTFNIDSNVLDGPLAVSYIPGQGCPELSNSVRIYDAVACEERYFEAKGLGLSSLEPNYANRAESIAMPSGWSVRLYADAQESAPSVCFNQSDSNFADNTFGDGSPLANRAVWMRVYNAPNCVDTAPIAAPVLSSPANGAEFGRTQSISLTWNSVSGASAYYVEVWSNGVQLQSGWVTGTSWSIGTRPAGWYQWRVKARNSTGQESGWNEIRTFAIRPGNPPSFSAVVASSTSITLNWGASSDAPGNIDGYRIYRNGLTIASPAGSALTFTNTGLTCGTAYTYSIRAYKGSLTSGAPASITITPPCPPLAFNKSLPANNALDMPLQTTLRWNASTNAQWYEICIDTIDNSACDTSWVNVGNVTSRIVTVDYATRYYWQVRARNAVGTLLSSGGWWTFLTVSNAPPHDEFQRALPVTEFPFNDSLSTRYATTSALDPLFPAECGTVSGQTAHASLWYQVTPQLNGELIVSTAASNFDTALVLWRVNKNIFTPLACNDDAHNTLQSEIIVRLASRTTYYVQVVGVTPADFGDLQLSMAYSSDAYVHHYRGVGARDGYIVESASGAGAGGGFNYTSSMFNVGDTRLNQQVISLLSFSTHTLPDNASIERVELRLMPFGDNLQELSALLGALVVDVASPHFGSSAALAAHDFSAPASATNIASPSYIVDEQGWYIITLDPQAFQHINLTGETQFRLRFAAPFADNEQADQIRFYSGDLAAVRKTFLPDPGTSLPERSALSQYAPQLLVYFRLP
jgi:hypothetical protein